MKNDKMSIDRTKKNPYITVMSASADILDITRFGDELLIGDRNVWSEHYPEFFRVHEYVILFVEQGWLNGRFNLNVHTIKAPAAYVILPDHVLSLLEHSSDCRLRVFCMSASFANELDIPLNYDFMHRLFHDPIVNMSVEWLEVCNTYLDLIKSIVLMPDLPGKHGMLLNLVRSFIDLLTDLYGKEQRQRPQMSRSESIVHQYLALVEMHCKQHHSIDWYAHEMCLTPKYIANVVKNETGKSAGDWINKNLLIYAKIMLTTTNLTIQQIGDTLGFLNQSHFGTWFRRETGVSPKVFRNL
ncbi:MAG: AraC family transcriptional regulator [Paludibacteraceae bacterium]|nr:AraC family transcriptional regulator [Paludibacteraceae bacterium]